MSRIHSVSLGDRGKNKMGTSEGRLQGGGVASGLVDAGGEALKELCDSEIRRGRPRLGVLGVLAALPPPFPSL